MVNIFTNEIEKQRGESKDKSKANPWAGGKREKESDGHDKPVVKRTKIKGSGRGGRAKKGQKMIVEGVSSDDSVAGLILI